MVCDVKIIKNFSENANNLIFLKLFLVSSPDSWISVLSDKSCRFTANWIFSIFVVRFSGKLKWLRAQIIKEQPNIWKWLSKNIYFAGEVVKAWKLFHFERLWKESSEKSRLCWKHLNFPYSTYCQALERTKAGSRTRVWSSTKSKGRK